MLSRNCFSCASTGPTLSTWAVKSSCDSGGRNCVFIVTQSRPTADSAECMKSRYHTHPLRQGAAPHGLATLAYRSRMYGKTRGRESDVQVPHKRAMAPDVGVVAQSPKGAR